MEQMEEDSAVKNDKGEGKGVAPCDLWQDQEEEDLCNAENLSWQMSMTRVGLDTRHGHCVC